MDTINRITNSLNILDFIKALITFMAFIFGLFIIFYRSIIVFWRLGKNLGKKVFIFCPTGGKRDDGTDKDMERELSVLKSSGYFNLAKGIVTDFNNIVPEDIESAGIVVLGYHKEMCHFEDFIQMVKQANKPLIIYTFELGYPLSEEHRKIICNYKWYALSSMPLRLVSDLFSIMSSYQYESKRS